MVARNKEVGVRLSVKDDGARKSFREFGDEGDRALAKIAREGREANDVLRQINASMAGTRQIFQSLSRLKGGIAGLVTGFVANATVQQVRDTARAVAEVGDAAKRAGLDLVSFQELKYVAEQNRIGVDQLADGMKELSLRADEFITTGGGAAAEAFQRLGYDAEQLKQKLKDPSALFTEIIGKLQALDRAAQIRVMDEIFGGSAGERFVELLGQGEAGLNRTRQSAHDLGLIMSEELVAKAGELDRAFQTLTETVSSGLHQSIVNASWALYDFLQQFWAVEDRTTSSLEQKMRTLGLEMIDLEAQRIETGRDRLPNGQLTELAKIRLSDIQARKAQIAEEEKSILNVLASRVPPVAPTATPAPAVASPAAGGGRSASARNADREREKIEGVIQALRDELAALNMTATEREVMNQLRRAGVDAASSEGQTIRGLVEQLSREKDAIAKIEDAMESLGGTAKDVLGTMVQGWREGKDAAEIYADVLDSLISKMLSSGIDMGVNALTGWLGGMFKPASMMGNGIGPGAGGWGNFASIFGAAHSGWKVGQGNPPQSRHLANLPRMHMGGLNRDEQLIVARRDEGIFTPRQLDNAEGLIQALMRNASQAGKGLESLRVEIINPAGDKNVESAEMRRGPDGSAVATIVLGAMTENFAGGKMDTVMNTLYGVKRIGR